MPRPAPRKKPRKDRGPMSAAVLIWMLPEERDRFREAAKKAELGLSAWLRGLGLREAAR